VKAAYDERVAKHQDRVQLVLRAFHHATAVLRGSFDPSCLAMQQMESAMAKRPADVEAADWGIVRQFKAAMDVLKKNYSSSTASDVAKLRTSLSTLTDEGPGGFDSYNREFTRLLVQLRATKADGVSDAELKEWVKKGIKNTTVKTTLLLKMYVEKDKDGSLKYSEILDAVTRLLVEMRNDDFDPYGLASGAKGHVGAHSADARGARTQEGASFDGCTKCWGQGHWWKACSARQCAVCKAIIGKDDLSCPNWKSHKQPFRFYGDVPPWERARGKSGNGGSRGFSGKRKAESSDRSGGGAKRSHYEPASDVATAKANLKAAYKAQRKNNKAAKKAAAAEA
jgi:hypothetical protein